MKRSSLIAAAIFTTILAGCGEKQAQPVVALPSAPSQAAAPAEPAIPLDKVDKLLMPVALASVDGVNGVILPKTGSTLVANGPDITIAGFAVDQVATEPASGVVVMIDAQPFVAMYGGERPDIAKALNNPNYVKSQFYAKIPTAGLSNGLHDITIRVIASDRSGYYASAWSAKVSVEK